MPTIMTDHMMNMSRKVKDDHGICDVVAALIIFEPVMADVAPIPIKVISPAAICLAITMR